MATLLAPFSKEFITYDLEFLDSGKLIHPVSIGMKSGDGRSLYAINREMPVRDILAHSWMRNNVWPHLPLRDLPEVRPSRDGFGRGHKVKNCLCKPVDGTRNEYDCRHVNGSLDMDHPDVRPLGQIRRMVSDFIMASHPAGQDIVRDNVKMWAWYGAYDHVALAQLWGPMISLPAHVPMLTHDLKSEAMRLGSPTMPEQKGTEHNALADAEGNHEKAKFLWELAMGKENAA